MTKTSITLTKNPWESLGASAALLVVLTVAFYIPAMHGGFVYDDYKLITNNRMVKASDGLHQFWLTTKAPDYYPLTWSLWWVEWRLWGRDAAGYHVVNVLFHAVNVVLVWLILQRLKIPEAWVVGLVFALHPVNAATVAWITEQKNTLSMLFYAVAILLYLRFDEEGRWRWYRLSLAAFLLALLSKSAVVMLPVVLLGCVWWMHGKVRRKDLLCALPFFALALASGLVSIWFQFNHSLEGHAVRTEGFAARLAAAGWVPWFYLGKALLPFNLTAIYPKWQIDASRWISYGPGTVLMGCFMLFWWKRHTWGRPLLFGIGYFVVMLFPVLGFFDQAFYQYSLVADHWQYYSIVGVIALAVAAGELIRRRLGEHGRYWGSVAVVMMLMALGAATWKRGYVYANGETFWRDNAAKNPNSWVAYLGLGATLWQAGRLPEAIVQLEQALRIKPDYADAHYNLGIALVQVGRLQEGIGHFEQAVRIKPDFAEAHNMLGYALLQAGETEEAIKHYEAAVRIKPDFTDARNALARLQAHQ